MFKDFQRAVDQMFFSPLVEAVVKFKFKYKQDFFAREKNKKIRCSQ